MRYKKAMSSERYNEPAKLGSTILTQFQATNNRFCFSFSKQGQMQV